jgi:hypothetical protein
MPKPKDQVPLKLGDRARSKLNRRVGTVDAVDDAGGTPQFGLRYDEQLQDRRLTQAVRDGAQLPAELIERE